MGINYGGLAGKARRMHVRESADRWFSNQLIADYYEPDEDQRPAIRAIPIRSRSEFVPSAMSFSAGEAAVDRQLDLPLNDGNAILPPQRLDDQALTPAADVDRAAAGPITIPFQRPSRRGSFSPLPLDWSKGSRPRRTSPFTLRGFMTGFAVGSAAAAVLLLFVSAAIG